MVTSFSRMGSAWVRHGFGFGVLYRIRGTAGAGTRLATLSNIAN